MEWSGRSITEVWDASSGRLLRQEQRFPVPPPDPYGSAAYTPLPCQAGLDLRPNPFEPNSTLAWVDDRWVRFRNGGWSCSHDDQWLMVFSRDGYRVRLTAINTQAIHRFELGSDRPQWDWSPVMEYQPSVPLLIANVDGPYYGSRMELFDIERGEWSMPINFFARYVAISPDGRWIAAAGAQTVTIWDIAEVRAR